MITSNRTFVQSFSSLSVFIFDYDFNWFITRLQCKPFCCELLLHSGAYQYAPFAMFWSRAPMKSDAASSGNLHHQRQHALESWRPRYANRIYPNRYDIICILKRRILLPFSTQAPIYGLPFSVNSRQEDGCHAYSSICKCNQFRITLPQRSPPRQSRLTGSRESRPAELYTLRRTRALNRRLKAPPP